MNKDKQHQFISQMELLQTLNFPEICDTIEVDFLDFETTLLEDDGFRDMMYMQVKKFQYNLLDQMHKYAAGLPVDNEPHLPTARHMLDLYSSGYFTRKLKVKDEEGEEMDAEDGLGEEILKRLGLEGKKNKASHSESMKEEES